MLKIGHAIATRKHHLSVTCYGTRNSRHRAREQFVRERVDAIAKFRRRRLGLRDCAARK
jgi:hypothetical protein